MASTPQNPLPRLVASPGDQSPAGTALREEARQLGRTEAQVTLPLKWGLLALVVTHWILARDVEPPSTAAFAIFLTYAMTCGGLHYFFVRDRVALSQVRRVAIASFALDIAFVTAVVTLDRLEGRLNSPGSPGGDQLVLFLFLVLRGFTMLRPGWEQLGAGLVLSVAGLGALVAWGRRPAPPELILHAGLVWGAILLTAFLMNLLARQREEALRVRERLVRSEGLASLGELAAGVAHEINNPIGIIKTYAEYLRKSTDPASANQEDYETIQKEAERCEAIVRRMLDFSNPNARALERVGLPLVAREVLDFVFHGKDADRGVSSTLVVEGEPPPILADPGQLKQAVLNIVMNARQVLSEQRPEGGRIDLTIRQLPGPRAPVILVVHDNGPGIGVEDAEKAFEPFFTRRSGGTGLGLAITRRIVEAHGGTIEIWPAANGGTNCSITLPIADEE